MSEKLCFNTSDVPKSESADVREYMEYRLGRCAGCFFARNWGNIDANVHAEEIPDFKARSMAEIMGEITWEEFMAPINEINEAWKAKKQSGYDFGANVKNCDGPTPLDPTKPSADEAICNNPAVEQVIQTGADFTPLQQPK
ncbi:MAG: hypothetical protein ABWX94_02140 [Candidatus Saccharimonadales bacterium]